MSDLRDSLTITATLYAIAAAAWLIAGCDCGTPDVFQCSSTIKEVTHALQD
jgi:hypothetical protein